MNDTTTITLTDDQLSRLRVALKVLAQMASAQDYRHTYMEANALYDALVDAQFQTPIPTQDDAQAKVGA